MSRDSAISESDLYNGPAFEDDLDAQLALRDRFDDQRSADEADDDEEEIDDDEDEEEGEDDDDDS